MIEPIKFINELKGDNKVLPNDTNLDILELQGIENKRKYFGTYTFNGVPVPRVSDILKETLNKDFLIYWALKLNMSLEEYKSYKKDILSVGTNVHNMIEHFCLYGKDKFIKWFYNDNIKNETLTAYNNFKAWYNKMIEDGYIITFLYNEKVITNPWFGGTIDCVMNIKHTLFDCDETLIVDFKTSKSISIDYLLQTMAYLWSWEWNKSFIDCTLPHIDGVMVLRIDKSKNNEYESIILDKRNPDIMNEMFNTVGSMINWFYHIINTKYNLSLLSKEERKRNKNGDNYFN